MTHRANSNFPFVEGRGYKAICFLLIHLRYIACGNMSAAIRAVQRTVILRKVDRTLDDSIIIHLHKVTLADFLILGDEAFTAPAANCKEMAAAYLLAVWILINGHITGAAAH